MVVFVRRQNHRVSRISAAVEKSKPMKMKAEINATVRLWIAGMGPSGTRRLRLRRMERKRWRVMEAEM